VRAGQNDRVASKARVMVGSPPIGA
jgi:hypothetical protein